MPAKTELEQAQPVSRTEMDQALQGLNNKIEEVAARLPRLEQEKSKTPSPNGSTDEHPVGLCRDEEHQPCVAQRQQLHKLGGKQGRMAMVKELNDAALEAGVVEVLEQLEQIITEKRDGKQPSPNLEVFPGVV